MLENSIVCFFVEKSKRMENEMKRINKMRLIVALLFSVLVEMISPMWMGNVNTSEAAVTVSFPIYKGNKAKITTIINQSKLSAKKKKVSKKLNWKSKNKKIVRISNKKVVARKAGTAKVVGYQKIKKKKKKKVITIRVKVEEKPRFIRTTKKGMVQGTKDVSKEGMVWYGIPYGASTAGKNRWKAPQPVEPWQGTRWAAKPLADAVSYQSNGGYSGTEDCLYVNVYRPYSNSTNLPVLVFLHGGGNVSGTANVEFAQMAASMGIVIVSVSFRLGAFGYLNHPALQDGTPEENSGNFTLLDIHKALVWVRDEIAVFGGNPNNVTLSGFSGGARNVLLCLIAPMMNNLFHKAFVMSGGYTTSMPKDGEKSLESRLATLLVKRGTYKTKEEAEKYITSATKPMMKQLLQSLTTAEVAWIYKDFKLDMEDFPHGFTDGFVLPKDGFDVIKQGKYNRVPLMIGSDATEFSSFAQNRTLFSEEMNLTSHSVAETMSLFEKGIQYGSMLQSCFYVENTVTPLYEDPWHRDMFAYRMLWGTNASVTDGFYSKYVGSYHGQTRDFLLGTYKHRMKEYSSEAVSSKNKKGRVLLTEQMRKYLKNFMIKGNPNGASLPSWTTWNPFLGSKKTMHLNAKKNKVSSEMSSELYDTYSILNQVKQKTTADEYKALTEHLWKGSFFMPAAMYKTDKEETK